MMKKVSWLLVAVMLATMLVPQVAAPVLAAEAIQLQEDFEAYVPGPFGGSGSPWSVASKEGCSMEVVTEGTNQVFKASLSYAGASQTTNDSYIQSSAYDFSGKTILSFRIKMENKNQGSMNLILRDTNANAGLGSLNLFSISNTQVKYLTDMQAAAVTETVDTEQWMTIQIVMDIANQTVTAYRDGVQKARAENIRSISSKLEGYNFAKASLRYQLYVGKTADNTVKMLLDDISMQSDFAADARFIVTGYTLTKQIGTISRPNHGFISGRANGWSAGPQCDQSGAVRCYESGIVQGRCFITVCKGEPDTACTPADSAGQRPNHDCAARGRRYAAAAAL